MMSRVSLITMLVMTVLMGVILSGVLTLQETGPRDTFWLQWLDRFISTYVIVLPTVLLVSPLAHAAARRLEASLFRASRDTPAAPRDIAIAAWRANGAGHGGGDFGPWLSHLADDVRITMPLGPFRGESIGKDRAAALYGAIAASRPRLIYDEPLRVSESDATVVIEFDDHGAIAGHPYRNRIAASFDIRDGKIAAYREYFGDIDPDIVTLMNAGAST